MNPASREERKEQGMKRGAKKNGAPKNAGRPCAGGVRVAAYCRVSTDLDGQRTSLEAQEEAFRAQIAARPEWELVGVYSDDGVSGTRAQNRPGFQRMIRDCEAGKIDYIVTKSISRFARNTMECLSYVRHLQSVGTQLLFQEENIDTGTAFSEMLLTVMAAFAQEESRSLSENLKWGIRKRFAEGKEKRVFVFGYRYDAAHNYVIAPEEADTVRRIYDLYEQGLSCRRIAETLMREKRPSAYCGNWSPSHVHEILTNEKYVGDVRMQKKYTTDHITHRCVKNDGALLPFYYVRDHHVPIVSRKQYDRVTKIRALKSKHGCKKQYPYDDKVVCPLCGRRMQQHALAAQNHELAMHCDRDGGSCGRYIVKSGLLHKAVLAAYRQVDIRNLRQIAAAQQHAAPAARAFVAMKEKRPYLGSVEYFWIDELVEKITFGENGDVLVYWKCGLRSEAAFPSERLRDDPAHLAALIRGKGAKRPADEEAARSPRGAEEEQRE